MNYLEKIMNNGTAFFALCALLSVIVITVAIVIRSHRKRNLVDKIHIRAGQAGERRLASKLAEIPLDGEVVLRNLYIPLRNGETTEIDAITINEYGIWVYEMKNYRGAISGNEHDKYWIQQKGFERRQFYNPIIQNQNHIKAIRNYLANTGQKIPFIHGYVVFGSSAFIPSNIKSIDCGHCVISVDDVPSSCKRYIVGFKRDKCLDKKDISSIARFLEKRCVNVNDRTKKKHIKFVQKNC